MQKSSEIEGSNGSESDSIELVIDAPAKDLGGFAVRRALPSIQRRLIGPFIFFDHMGPLAMPPGRGFDVRPHPHIALATITYLFEGEFIHRDSLGSEQPIRPGDVNWMIAGRGIVHSERTGAEARASGARLHGIQMWVALPTIDEEREPLFEHHARASMPVVSRAGASIHIIAGDSYGARAPTSVLSPTLLAHARLEAGADLHVDDTHEERAAYIASGSVECDGRAFGEGSLVVFRRSVSADLRALAASDVMLIGGAPIDGPRHIYWNFISSSKERIERAKDDWRSGRFPKVPGDEIEFIPLPEGA